MRRTSRFVLSRPPIGAVWGWVQTVVGRTATDSLLPGGALVLSPHQDDETIGCGLLMAEKAHSGIPVAVAVATDGSGGWYAPTPRPEPQQIAEIRRREWHQALDLLAVHRENRFEFGFPDSHLSDHETELAERISDLFRRVRPSQVYVTRPGDPHPDHRALAQAVGQAVAETYGPDDASDGVADGRQLGFIGPRPRIFSYRVYPGEGLWSDGRPSRVTVGTAVVQFIRSVLGLRGGRALLLRASGSVPTKASAIDAYESQSTLLGGELRYVWNTGVELFWPMFGHDSTDVRGAGEQSI